MSRDAHSEAADVVEVTSEGLPRAIENAVAKSGVTAEELLAQGRSGRFDTLQARLAWVAIGNHLERLLDPSRMRHA